MSYFPQGGNGWGAPGPSYSQKSTSSADSGGSILVGLTFWAVVIGVIVLVVTGI